MMKRNVMWDLEGELLQVSIKRDKLKKKAELTEEEEQVLVDLEKRHTVLEKRIRQERMRGYHKI